MLNALTIDVEDYFQVHAFSDVIKFEDWGNYECRIERNIDRLLEVLNSVRSPQNLVAHSLNNSLTQRVKATFFVLGWIAERYPDLVQRIQKEGHEIACHGYSHKLVYTQSEDEFRQDIRKAKAILEDITGSEVVGYRAPSYSITNKSRWAFDVLVEEGFKYDSSIFPIHHDFYGIPNAPRFPFAVSLNGNENCEFSMLNCELGTAAPQHGSTAAFSNSLTQSPDNLAFKPQSSVLMTSHVSDPQGGSTAAPLEGVTPNSALSTQHYLLEFPVSTVRLLGQNLPISGGGYFRLFPYSVIRRSLKGINQREKKAFLFYIHPWEIDTDQPRIGGLSFRSKFRHYVNLDKTEDRFRKLLGDFQFSTIHQILIQNS
jgi:polysaccharide deacetylase family protein (PEP-CTERM system associated)